MPRLRTASLLPVSPRGFKEQSGNTEDALRHADKTSMSPSRSPFARAARLMIGLILLVLGVAAFTTADAQSVFRFPATTAVGSAAAAQTVTVNITHAGSLSSIKVRTQGNDGFDFTSASGGSCSTSTSYSAGQHCTVNVAFTPAAPGERRGAVILLDSGNAVLGTQWLTATATGPVGTFIPGTINTVAGDTTWIYAGDGGLATSSSIFLPFGVAVDARGDMFIADSSNGRIRKVDGVTNIISTIAGNGTLGATGDGGPALQATIANPTSIAVDPAGNVFFADNGNNLIRRISAFDATISTVAGTIGAHGYTGDNGPATAATLNSPNGLAIDASGDLYIADTANNVIRLVNAATGVITTVAGNGNAGFTGDAGLATSATLNAPWGVTVSPTGLLYIADQGNNRIRLVSLAGTISTILGNGSIGYTGDGGPAASATTNVPAGVAIDVAGNLYIADSGNNVVRKINAVSGIITTIAGNGSESISGDNGPADKAGLYGPYTLTLDSQGSLLIADVFHNRIRKVYSNSATLDYKAIRVGRVSTPLQQTLENDGNASLDVSTITAVSNAQVDVASTTCSATVPLTPLVQCLVGADFAPTVVGNPVTGSMNVASDASNSPGVIYLVGQVLNVDPATVTLTSSSNPSITGAAVVFTVDVSSVGTTPTGSVSLLDGADTLATGQLGPGGSITFTVSTLAPGQHSMTASYAGDTNNAAGVSDPLIQVVKDQVAATTTTLSTSANPVYAGAPLFFTAQIAAAVAGSGNGAITGSVVFKYGSTQLGSANVNNGAATLSVTSLPVGADSVVAIYGGNASYGTSTSAPLVQNVQIASTSTFVTSSANPSSAGGPVTLAATVSGNGGIPTGSVTFFDGSVTLGKANLNVHGLATLAVAGTNWTVGAHTITATYAGDASDTGSTSVPFTENIVIASSTIRLISTLNPSPLGAPVTFGATLNSSGGLPTGNVQFFDGTTPLSTDVIDPRGYASMNTALLTVGSHNITAVYAGDANDSAITSSVLVQVVQPANISAVLTVSSNPAILGKPLTITATVTGNGSAPAGSVTFADGAATLGIVQLAANGTASFVTSNLTIGAHSLTAAYSGDANHAAVGSNTIALKVVQGTTTTLSTSNLNPIAGSTVTWTAAVSGDNGQPTTGAISILDGKTVIATLTPGANGVATMTGASLAPGTHNVTAAFAGDTYDAASTSTPLVDVVTIATTTATLTSSVNPSFSGTPVTFSTTVAGNGGIPTGNVAFKDGTKVLNTVPLDATGNAAFTISTLAPGIHKITANYLGDIDDATAVSSTLSQQVAEKTTVTLTSSANPSLLTDNVTFTTTVANGVTGETPTGTVTLSDGGTTVGTATLSATGTASFTLTAPSLGQHTMVASYAGDDNNVPAVSANLIQVVNLRPSSTSLTVSSTAISTGQQLILISVVQGSGNAAPTGTVTFASGATVFGSAPIGADGVATITVNPVQGQYKIVGTYSGDTLFATSNSPSVAVTVGPPVEFALNMTPPTMTMQSGNHGTIQVNISTAATFHDTLAFGCAGLPASATCTFSNDKVSVAGGVSSNLSVIVDTGDPLGVGATARLHNPTQHGENTGGILACMLPAGALLLFLGRRKYRKPLGLLVAVLMLAGVATLSGCGNTFKTTDTPAGTYTFQIVATGQTTGATQAGNVTLTVTK